MCVWMCVCTFSKYLSSRGLDEISAGFNSELRRALNERRLLELACLDDDLQQHPFLTLTLDPAHQLCAHSLVPRNQPLVR